MMFLFAPAGQAQLVGNDTAPGDSCVGKPAGATRVTADADQDGKEVTLICDGSTWRAASEPAALGDLEDVNIPTPSDGQTLTYDSASSKWIATATSGATATLYGGSHTETDCYGISGYVRGTPSGLLCVYDGTSCPSGWTQLSNWGATAPHYCYGSCGICTTGMHLWAATGRETCIYHLGTTSCAATTCYATVIEVGCY